MKFSLFFLFFTPFVSFGQSDIGSIIREFEQSESIEEKAGLADDISWKLKDVNPDSSLFYALLALKFSRESNQKKIEAYSLSGIGNYHKRKENYKLASEYYLKSLEVRESLKDQELIASGYNQLGILYKQQEKFDSAEIYFLAGISIVKETQFTGILLKLYDGYAMTLYHLNKAERALAYLDSVFVLAQEVNDPLTIAKSMQNKGVINQYLGQYKLALKFYRRAIDHYRELGNINGEIEVMINEASVFLTSGETKEAEQLLLDAEQQSINFGFEDNLFIIYMDLAKLYKQTNLKLQRTYLEKAYKNALVYDKMPTQIESGIELGIIALRDNDLEEAYSRINDIKDLNTYLSKENKSNLYILESSYWEASDNYRKALDYSRKALSLKDSLHHDLNNLQDISALLENERYEKELATEELRAINAEKEEFRTKLSKDRIIIGALLVGGFLLVLLFYGKRRRLKVEHEKELQEEQFKTQLKFKENENELAFLEESLILETTIRQNIGRDLHDRLGSKLAVVQITLDAIVSRGFSYETVKSQLNEAIDLVEKSCKDIRTISHNLIEHELSKESLYKALKDHCESITRSGHLKFAYDCIGEPFQLSLTIKKHLYATITLLIDNIVKHAQAKNAHLQLFYHNNCINVQLDDDGIGINSEFIKERSGFGLTNAKDRVKKMNGVVEIDSPKNQGTYVSISIPISHD